MTESPNQSQSEPTYKVGDRVWLTKPTLTKAVSAPAVVKAAQDGKLGIQFLYSGDENIYDTLAERGRPAVPFTEMVEPMPRPAVLLLQHMARLYASAEGYRNGKEALVNQVNKMAAEVQTAQEQHGELLSLRSELARLTEQRDALLAERDRTAVTKRVESCFVSRATYHKDWPELDTLLNQGWQVASENIIVDRLAGYNESEFRHSECAAARVFVRLQREVPTAESHPVPSVDSHQRYNAADVPTDHDLDDQRTETVHGEALAPAAVRQPNLAYPAAGFWRVCWLAAVAGGQRLGVAYDDLGVFHAVTATAATLADELHQAGHTAEQFDDPRSAGVCAYDVLPLAAANNVYAFRVVKKVGNYAHALQATYETLKSLAKAAPDRVDVNTALSDFAGYYARWNDSCQRIEQRAQAFGLNKIVTKSVTGVVVGLDTAATASASDRAAERITELNQKVVAAVQHTLSSMPPVRPVTANPFNRVAAGS